MFRDDTPFSEPVVQASTYSSEPVQQFLNSSGGGVLFAVVLCAIIFLVWRA